MRQFGVRSQLPLCSWIKIKCSFSPCWLYDNMATLMTSVHTSYTLERKESKMYCIYPSTSQPTNGKCFISEGGEGREESMSRCACIPYCLKLDWLFVIFMKCYQSQTKLEMFVFCKAFTESKHISIFVSFLA